MADISGIKSGARTIDIMHPATGEPVGIKVTLVSYDSPTMKKIRRRILDSKLSKEAKGQAWKADELEGNRNLLMFNAMTAWEWGNDANGEPATFRGEAPAFTQRNVFDVLDELPWFRDQLDEAVADEKAFFTNSAPN